MRLPLRSPFPVVVPTSVVTLVLVASLSTPGCVIRVDRPEDRNEKTAEAALADVAEDLTEHALEKNLLARMREGLPIEKLPDPGIEEFEDEIEFAREILERLDDIDADELGHDDWLTWSVLRWQQETTVDAEPYYWLDSFLTSYSTPLASLQQIFQGYVLADEEDLEEYLELVEQTSGFVRALNDRAVGAMERGIVVPQPALPAVIGIVEAAIAPADAGAFALVDARVEGLDEDEVDEAREELAQLVEDEVNPALRDLTDFLAGEYTEAAPEGVGITQYPGGEDYYRYLVRASTTMNVTPEEVQRIGFEMLDQMRADMDEIRAQTGFEGTRDEFHEFLRTDPRFFPTTPDEVGERLKSASDAMLEHILDFFLEVPEAPYDVRRLHPSLEGSQTYGYYTPPTAADTTGYYNYNGSNLDERSWINLEGVSLHEMIPGHHFHIARQYESDDLPSVRKDLLHGAYTEGWGSYASLLGLEAGMYEDPYSRYGMYVLESFLATRLVVDPGMNAFGWSLERGRTFMRENTLESETQIATESLRYSTDMPGQGLAYQMGKRGLLELRARAQETLGDRFDIRRFHEAILGPGSMPMSVLGEHIDWFIEQELAHEED